MPFSIGPSFYLSLTCSLFPFFLFFFFLLIFFLFVFLFPFAVLRCPLLFVWSFSLFFQYEVSLLLRFSFRFPAPLVADSVILSRCYPPALLASLQICVPLVGMYSSCVLFFLAFLFLSVFTFLFMIFFFSFLRYYFYLDVVAFFPSYCCLLLWALRCLLGLFCCYSFSV